MKVVKRDGSLQGFDRSKIKAGLNKASNRSDNKLSNIDIDKVIDNAMLLYKDSDKVSSDSIYQAVTESLREINEMALQEYLSFNKYRDRYSESFKEIVSFSDKVMFTGDKENANKDTQLNSTKQAVISEETMRQLMREFELNPEWVKAHDEGWVYIHDLGSRYLNGVNCCLFDMGNLLKGGFEVNGMVYREPDTVQTAINVVGDSILSASGNQYGGFTVPEIDTVLAPYAEKTYDRWIKEYTEDLDGDIEKAKELAHKRTMREIEKGYIGLETKINSISNSLGQTAFTTLTLGMDTSYWGRQIAKTILKVRQDGVDKDGTTSIFPKLVMLVRSDVNRDENTPNHDIYRMAIETSRTRLYPDYLSLDGENNNLADIYEKSGQIVSPMGCRAYLGEFYHPETKEMVITGRNNIGAISINIPKIAIESDGNKGKFFKLLDKYIEMVWAIHDDTWEKIAKSKGSTNPLLFCENGSWMSVGYDEEIRPIVKASTASIAYIGLNEASEYLFNEPITKHQDFGLEVVQYLRDSVDREKGKREYLPAIYSTPAEGLAYKWQIKNREQYGLIEKVTDNEYMTNSFHVHVKEDISPIEKAEFEAPFHAIATGGRISYAEFPNGVSFDVLKDCVDHAMKQGLYYGVNVVSSSCNNCAYQGDFLDSCPKCHSEDITTVSRVCGYLSYSKVKGDTRYNPGKKAEILDRIKHVKEDREWF